MRARRNRQRMRGPIHLTGDFVNWSSVNHELIQVDGKRTGVEVEIVDRRLPDKCQYAWTFHRRFDPAVLSLIQKWSSRRNHAVMRDIRIKLPASGTTHRPLQVCRVQCLAQFCEWEDRHWCCRAAAVSIPVYDNDRIFAGRFVRWDT